MVWDLPTRLFHWAVAGLVLVPPMVSGHKRLPAHTPAPRIASRALAAAVLGAGALVAALLAEWL